MLARPRILKLQSAMLCYSGDHLHVVIVKDIAKLTVSDDSGSILSHSPIRMLRRHRDTVVDSEIFLLQKLGMRDGAVREVVDTCVWVQEVLVWV